MKHLLSSILLILILSSCIGSDDTQARSQNTTSLEGVWKLQNIQTGAKLTFQGQNWRLDSGTDSIIGTFTVSGNTLSGVAVTRNGASAQLIQPDNFLGNFTIANNRVTFTNFQGYWVAPFSSWYQKQ